MNATDSQIVIKCNFDPQYLVRVRSGWICQVASRAVRPGRVCYTSGQEVDLRMLQFKSKNELKRDAESIEMKELGSCKAE